MGFFTVLFLILLVLKIIGIITIGWGVLLFILCVPAILFSLILFIFSTFK